MNIPGGDGNGVAVEARQLTKRYGDTTVVSHIDLQIRAGTCFGLLGPNGAGKTTTLKMILGQSPPSDGSLNVFGLPIPEASSTVRSRLGVVPQIDNLDPDFTVAENLKVYASYFHIPRAEAESRIAQLLDFVELSDRAQTAIENLSGGMKRRLTIARALINDPELLVLDEPTTGLDPQARHAIWARLRDLKHLGKTVVLTSHYMEEAERLCDELVIMDHGVIVAQGTPMELVARHVEPEVLEMRGQSHTVDQRLLAELDQCRVEVVGDTVYCYTQDAGAIIPKLDDAPHLSVLHRPANLEDVFLTITGRALRD